MARDIGPDMLANLDNQLKAGNITQARYDARREEILELIRRGDAVQYSKFQKVATIAGSLLIFVLGIWFAFGALVEQSITALVFSVAMIALGFSSWRRVTRI